MKTNYRPLRTFGLIGFALLAVSTAGAIFALHPSGASGARPGDGPAGNGGPGSTAVIYGNLDLQLGVVALFPTQPGRVVDIKVHENQAVKKDAVLLRMDDRLAKYRLEQAKADYEAAKAQHAQAVQLPAQHKAKLEQQQAAIDAMQHDLAAAQHTLERRKQMVKDKLANPLDVSAAEELVKKLEAGVRAEQAKLRELQLVDPATQVTRARAEEDAKKAQLEQAQYALDECNLVAPSDGEVLQVLINVGSILVANPQQPAIMFAPAGPRIVRAEVEQEFASRLQVGQTVIVQDEHVATPECAGKIVRISDWYTRSRLQGQDPTRALSSEMRTLECIVTLEPGPAIFRLGQRVRVTAGKVPSER